MHPASLPCSRPAFMAFLICAEYGPSIPVRQEG